MSQHRIIVLDRFIERYSNVPAKSFISRALFIFPLFCFGILHFVNPHFFEFMVPSYAGFPFFWVNVSGVVLSSTALLILFNYYSRYAALFLMAFVLVFITTVDIPHLIADQGDLQMYFIISAMKDFSLLGGSLMYFLSANYFINKAA